MNIYIAFALAKPSSEIKKLLEEKALANLEIADIKSIQLELVKHSLLTRKVIKIEKRVEKLQEETKSRFKRVKSISRASTVCFYIYTQFIDCFYYLT